MSQKSSFIFVGSFITEANDGTVGGQMFACQSLLESPLSTYVDWQLVDSTMRSQPPPHLVVRFLDAGRRLLRVGTLLVSSNADGILIFSAYELSSLLEKGLMCIFGKICRKHVVLSFRSEIRPYGYDRWLRWYKRLVIRCSTTIVCQSQVAANSLVKLMDCPVEKLVVIPNWIDSKKYRRPNISNEQQAEAHRLVTLIFVGWLEPFKGVQDLLEAVKILHEEGFQFRVIICGDGSQRTRLQEYTQINQLEGCVEFRGWVTGTDKLKVLWDADIFVLPSYSEGFPNSVVEAMAARLAIVSTTVGGIPTLVKTRQNGILITPGDTKALTDSLKWLLLNPVQVRDIGIVNQETVSRYYDIQSTWLTIAQVLNLPIESVSEA